MCRASTPGSVLPSISSSEAPPPVETWVTRSSRPNCASAATESPPPTTVVPGHVRDGLARPRACRRERLQLERAHRAVPEHACPRAVISPRTPPRCCGPTSRPIQPSGTSTPSSSCVSVSAANARPSTRSSRQLAACRAAGSSSARLAGSMPSSSHSEAPTSWPWALKNGKHIAPPMSTASATLEEARRARRSCRSPSRRRRSPRAGAPGRRGSPLSVSTSRCSSRPAAALGSRCATRLRRRVRAVRGAERVVDVDVGERARAPSPARGRSSSPPARSARSRASGPRRRRARRPRPRPRARRPLGQRDRRVPAGQLGEAQSAAGRSENSGSTRPSAGRGALTRTSRAPALAQRRERRQRGADARVVGDVPRPRRAGR